MNRRNDYRHKARRPSLTPLFTGSLSFWLGCAVAYSSGLIIRENLREAAVLAAVLALAFCVLCYSNKVRILALAATFLCAGSMLGFSKAIMQVDTADAMQEKEVTAEFRLVEDSRNGSYGQSALAILATPDMGLLECRVSVEDSDPLFFRETYRSTVKLKPIDFEKDSRAWSQGICATVYMKNADQVEAEDVSGFLAAARRKAVEAIGAEDEAHATLQAIVCGYRPSISTTKIYSSYQTAGLAHLVAVSGAHLVIVTGLFSSALRALGVGRKISMTVIIVIMLSYLALSGCPVSAVRATFMSGIGVLSPLARRRASSLNALGVGVIAMLAANPVTALSASFALSVLATAGIIVFGPLLNSWFQALDGSFAFITEPLSMTISANLLSQLYACSLFGLLPLVSPLANIACSIIFPLVCGFGIIAGLLCMFSAPVAGIAVDMAALLAFTMNEIVTLFASLPFAAVPFKPESAGALGASAALAFLLWAWWPQAKQGAVLLLVVPALFLLALFIPDMRDAIVMFDVGQGDSFLLRSKGQTLLVDTGKNDGMLADALARNKLFKIDNVMVTHADDDHCGSLDTIAQRAHVDRFLLAAGMMEQKTSKARGLVAEAEAMAQEIVPLQVGDVFEIGSFTCTVVWPHELKEEGGNADSLCMWVDYDGDGDGAVDFTALFTGDAEREELQQMIDERNVGSVDLLKVGHHGSRNGMTEDEARVLHPRIALIGVGAKNRYGHPTAEILDMLGQQGTEVFRSDEDGEVTCELSARGVRVHCEAYN